MISVVIPTYNRHGCVTEAVASVLAQQDVDMEVIVVDDGSTDDTGRVMESFGSSIRYVLQRHAGVSAARNRGIRMAQGEWLAFLDSDDLWLPGKLSSQMTFFSDHPDSRICQTEEIWVRNGRRLNPGKIHRKPEGYCFPLLLERCLISPSAVVVHRDVLSEVGAFDESLPACEDYDLWLRIGYRYAFGLVKEPLVVKRGGRPDQLSSSVPCLDRYRIHALVKLLRSEPLTKAQKEMTLNALRGKCRVYGDGCRKRGRMEEAHAVLALPEELGKQMHVKT